MATPAEALQNKLTAKQEEELKKTEDIALLEQAQRGEGRFETTKEGVDPRIEKLASERLDELLRLQRIGATTARPGLGATILTGIGGRGGRGGGLAGRTLLSGILAADDGNIRRPELRAG